jgi:5-oxopent-3-ene-1,2,5-tricarboxylate decarboxylase/2-hydroxyhepta-2,4-diene-1,7-dioate isomerase
LFLDYFCLLPRRTAFCLFLILIVKIRAPSYNLFMKIGRFSLNGREFTGMVENVVVVELEGVSLPTAVFNGSLLPGVLEKTAARKGKEHRLDALRFLPLWRPGKIVCLGLNYRGHIKEGDWVPPEEPVYFEKSSNCVIAHNDIIVVPAGIGRVDPEVELAAVIGRNTTGLDPDASAGVILGWTVLNDVTARALQRKDQAKKYPWFRSKSMDTFCPFGPWLVTVDELPSGEGLSIESRINGKVCQSSNTSEMIFSAPDVISFVSKTLTLEPGDIVSMGTPEGIAPIIPGDFVECVVSRIGTLANRVV